MTKGLIERSSRFVYMRDNKLESKENKQSENVRISEEIPLRERSNSEKSFLYFCFH